MQLSIQEASISLTRLGEIYDVEEENEIEENSNSEVIDEGIGDISLKNITFRYGSRQPALTNVSIDIPKGKKIALVGRSGCGKTTLSKLLLKFYTPESGSLTINNMDIKDIDAFTIREKMGCIPQNIQTFSGSVRDNILIGNPHATQGELELACRLAGCDEFVSRLPKSYDTFLDENGGGLSGGEKQRIAIARALIKNPSFVIFDEATSSMDFITEQRILDTIYNRFHKTSMLIIAHRLSTIRWCDMIYVMDSGSIVEQGIHEELVQKNGLYAKMWNEQMCINDSLRVHHSDDISPNNMDSEKLTNTLSVGDEIEYN